MTEADEARQLAGQVLDRLLAGRDTKASSTFATARQAEDPEAYAAHVWERARAVGPLLAACEDLADAVGSVDVDEAVPSLRAVADQWQHVAASLEPRDGRAVLIRAGAHQVHQLTDDGIDPEYATDLISIAVAQSQLLRFAVERSNLRSDAGREKWWTKNGEQVRATAEIWAYLRADVIARGGDLWADFEPQAEEDT